MRIGLFQRSLPEPDRKPGGVEVFVERLAGKLVERGHAVTVFSFVPAPAGAPFRYVRLEPAWAGRNRLAHLSVVPVVLNRIDTSALDVLHLHGDDWFFFRRRLPTVRTFHGSALLEARSAARWRRRLSQLAVFPLELMSSRLATASYSVAPGMPPGYRLRGTLGLGIDLPNEDISRPDPPIILFVGTWTGRKRGRFLYETFKSYVQPRVPSAELWLVSDAAPVNTKGVRWLPRPTDTELSDLYRRAWVLCLPSTYEGFGMPYLEAMAHATPVIASPNTGSRFISDSGRAAWLAPDDSLGPSLVRLLGDSRARRRLAEAGRDRARAFSWDQMLDLHERAYELAISRWS